MGAQGKAPPMAESMQRVKVKRLNEEGKWDDRGTGHISVDYLEVAALVLLVSICSMVLYVLLLHDGSAESVAMDAIHKEALSQLKDGSRSILPINVSAVRLARLLSSSSRSHLEKQVAHDLFILHSTLPHLSKVSYFGEDGLFFAYHSEENRTVALFSNTMIPPFNTTLNRTTNGYRWYHQEVDEITGTPHGQAVDREPMAYWTSTWFRSALLSDHDRAQWGIEWSNQQPLFTCIVPVTGLSFRGHRGVVALGVPVKVLSDFLSLPWQLHGGGIFLGTKDRKLIEGYQFYNGMLDRWEPTALTANFQTLDANDQLQIFLHTQNGDSNMKNGPVSIVDMNVQGRRYTLHTAHFKLFELPLVSTLAFPRDNVTYLGTKGSNLNWFASAVISVVLVLMTCLYVVVTYRAFRITVLLRSSLIKQIEATRQAERKSMNKTIAFASTSHDVRTILAAILGLLDHCISNVSHNSELRSCLVDIKSFSLNLLGILNSVLDISKIEAGKMQLEEVEYDLAQVLEDAVDMFYVSAIEKCVEVVLDPCDGTIQKYSRVKGDCKRFQQILCNLLSNAVKFTSEGHIMVRAWAKKARSRNFMLPLNENGHDHHFRHYLSPWYCCNNTSNMDFKSLQGSTNEENMIEVVIEVDDTGKGIPKDKHKSVFENFVQVKDVDSGNYGGIGLGLGIVQSIVRLMGGEINIVDKAPSTKGTCFRFSIIMKAAESSVDLKDSKEDDRELLGVHVDQSLHQPETSSNTDLAAFAEDFDVEGTCAILLLKGEARKRILKKWMEEHKLKVYALDHLEKLRSLLETLKPNACSVTSTCSEIVSDDGGHTETGETSSMGKDQELDSVPSHAINDDRVFSSSMSKRSGHMERLHSILETLKPKACSVATTCSEIVSDDDGLTETGGTSSMRKDQELDSATSRAINEEPASSSSMSMNRRSGRQRIVSFRAGKYSTNLLFIVEMDHRSDLQLQELSKMFSNFIHNAQEFRCKVVWLAGVSTQSMDVEALKKSGAPCDLIFHKPLHGSRLYQTLGLVCEFGRRSKGRQATVMNSFLDPQPTNIGSCATDVRSHVACSSCTANTCQWLPDRSTASKISSLHGDKPLKGFKVLVVDDNVVLLRLMMATLARLGASVDSCKNGEDAFVLVRKSLQGWDGHHGEEKHSREGQEEVGAEKMLYDLIFMDCEMPTMNGYEATRKIRKEEKHYSDVHVPIIALTAHAMAEETSRSLQSGMDFHLVKPVAENELLDAIQKVLRV
ncbi:probable histidine kinase 2 isoform X1 [Nymphaea colorata]|nr:probable histidine kinase 2 isoform X1 [Nymphaea colorata]XP_031498688.1 probable histidine kinase 2 isoform X1 [Nymphaea colorata]